VSVVMRIFDRRPIAATILLIGVVVPWFGACTSCSDMDGPGVDNTLATAERWLHVLSWRDMGVSEGTDKIELDLAPVRPDGLDGRPQVESISLHRSFMPSIEDAIGEGDAVYLAMASHGLEREMVSFVVAVTAEGDHRLLGECAGEGEALLRERLEGRYDDVMSSVIGSTGRRRIVWMIEAL
jgi:hypothetical protein